MVAWYPVTNLWQEWRFLYLADFFRNPNQLSTGVASKVMYLGRSCAVLCGVERGGFCSPAFLLFLAGLDSSLN
jgi:hypothetical protein